MAETPQGFQPVAETPAAATGHGDEMPSPDHRNLAVLAHLSAAAGLIGIPLGNILGPLIVWLVTKEKSPFLDDQGKEALNFQIGATIAAFVCGALIMVGTVLAILIAPIILIVVGFIGIAALLVFVIIVMIQAAIAVNKGIWYRYPIRMTFVK